jgi:hypothetical protein
MALTDTAIKKLKADGKPIKVADERGLFLLVKPSGAKLWHWKYRFQGKEKLMATVQRFGEDERALHDRLGVQCEAVSCEFAAVVAAGNCRLDIRFERPRVQHNAVGAGLTNGGMRHIGFLHDRAGVAGGLGDRVGEQGFPQLDVAQQPVERLRCGMVARRGE